LNLEKAVMDRCGWCLVGSGSLQVNASVSQSLKTCAGTLTRRFTRKDNIGHATKSLEAAFSKTSLENTFSDTIVAFTSNFPGTRSGPENFIVVGCVSTFLLWCGSRDLDAVDRLQN
jgi:hypothetical protein